MLDAMRVLRLFGAISMVAAASIPAVGQNCPDPGTWKPSAAASTLHGVLTYHDELRQWLGLKLGKGTCGENEIELVFHESKDWREAEALRDCEATVIGRLFYSGTGYYSAAMAMADPAVAPDETCQPHAVNTDPGLAPRKQDIRNFVAEIVVDYQNKAHVAVRVWKDRHRESELKPWQAYVNYELTGSRDVIWFGCTDGFEIKQISQTPKPKGGPFQDESNAAGTVLPSERLNTVSFTCAIAAVSPAHVN
jgi:hypothetical protein